MQSEPYQAATRTTTLLPPRGDKGCVYRHLMAACALAPVDNTPYHTIATTTTTTNTTTTNNNNTTTNNSNATSSGLPSHHHQQHRHVKVRALLSLLTDQHPRLVLPGEAVMMAHVALALNHDHHHSNNNTSENNDNDNDSSNCSVPSTSSSTPSASPLPSFSSSSSSSSMSSRLLGGLYVVWVSYNWGRGRGGAEGSVDAYTSHSTTTMTSTMMMPLSCAQVGLSTFTTFTTFTSLINRQLWYNNELYFNTSVH